MLYGQAGLDVSDIAKFVGHKGEAATAGYVRSLGERPMATAADGCRTARSFLCTAGEHVGARETHERPHSNYAPPQ